MCDCITYLPESGKNRFSYFAKNSDREPNEIQLVEHYPKTERKGKLRVTHIDVSFDSDVNEIVISRPEWMWGAEMGFNEHGVNIGNEAVFTSAKPVNKGLLGMDLLRIALELSDSAGNAAEIIAEYLEKYGQGGSNSRTGSLYYNNSFLITDRKESVIMDIVGSEWRVKKLERYGSISNFSADPDGYLKETAKSRSFSLSHDHVYTPLGKGRKRQMTTYSALGHLRPGRAVEDMMNIMRTHRRSGYHPSKGGNDDICMHSGPISRINKTVNSMITRTGDNFTTGWFTFSSNPCISLYKPVFLVEGIARSIDYDRDYWLMSEKIHRSLFFRSPEIYQEAMSQTLYNQALINELVQPLCYRIGEGERVEQAEVDEMSRLIKDIDSDHLHSLFALAESSPETRKNNYSRWWEKTDSTALKSSVYHYFPVNRNTLQYPEL